MSVKVDKMPSTRLSRKSGKLDGREGLPELQTENPHSPFLEELATIGEQHFAQITEQLNGAMKKLDENQSMNRAKKAELNQGLTDIEQDIELVDEVRTRLDAEYVGDKNQSAASRVTDRRYLTSYFYYPIILFTIIGELVITYPAFETIFGENKLFAILTTVAASSLTVAYAYVLGLTLKRRDDKRHLLQRWVLPAVLMSSVFFLLLVSSLSHLRAINFSSAESSTVGSSSQPQGSNTTLLGQPNNDSGLIGVGAPQPLAGVEGSAYDSALTYTWAFLLFLSLQLALIIVATLGEYFHYSHLEAERRKVLKSLKKLRTQREKLKGQIDKVESDLGSADKDVQQIYLAHTAELAKIRKKVEARAQAFWGSNIRQRADSPNARSRRFSAPELKSPDWV